MYRLPTDTEDTDPIDDEVPTLPVEDLPPPIAASSSRKDRLAAEAHINPITREEFVDEQERDTRCQALRAHGGSQNNFDSSGILVRIFPLDGRGQIVVPETLRPRVLRLAHFTVLARHPGGCRMYHTLRQSYY